MNRKIWTFVSLLVLAALVLAACGPSATPAPTEAVSPTEPLATQGPVSCPAVTVKDMMGLTPAYPQQFELAEFEAAANCELTFTENPLFAGQDVPPIEERLPDEPLVVAPYDEPGVYGGRMNLISLAPESGTAENLSYRHVALARYSDDLQTIVPNVAKSWEWNDDFSQLTFHLRQGHKWSDGEPFTADDILFWYYDIQMNPAFFPTPRAIWLTDGKPMDIIKVDDLTVTFDFHAPRPGALILFANSYIQPFQPKHFLSQFHITYNPAADELAKSEERADWVALFRSYYDDWKDSFHRLVPTLESYYVLEEDTQHRLVVANPYYFKVDTAGQQLPYINEQNETFISDMELINLKITSGEVDLKSNALSLTNYPLYKDSEAQGDYRVELPPAGLAGGMGYTLNVTSQDPVLRELFNDVRFKQALSLAIDREDINQTVFLGLATATQYVPADPLYVNFVTEDELAYVAAYDPDQANALLDEIGLTKGADGFRLRPDGKPLVVRIEFTVLGGPALTHELVKQYWEAIGVKVELKEVSTEVFRTANLGNDFDVYMWRTDGTDAPSLISDTYNVLVPFQASGLQVKTGLPWGQYWATDGKEGEQPPAWAEQLRQDVITFGGLAPYSDEWNALGSKIVKQWQDQLITIGTVRNVPVPLIVSNRLGNTPPEFTTQIFGFYCLYPFRVDQMYIKQ